MYVPSALHHFLVDCPQFAGRWKPRQPANPLDPHQLLLVMSPSIFVDAQSVPSPKFPTICLRELSYCHNRQNSFSRYLPWAKYAQNSLCQATTGLTPFQCILGYQLPLISWPGESSEVPAVNHCFQESERVWDSAHIHLQRAVQRQKNQANAKELQLPSTIRVRRSDSLLWITFFICPIISRVPATLVHSLFRGRSMMSPTS